MKTGKEIILLTFNFPFNSGEAFIEDEVDYWSSYFSGSLTILPIKKTGISRKIPGNVIVNTILSEKHNIFLQFLYCVNTLFSGLFFKEVLFVLKNYNITRLKCFLIAFRTVYSTLLIYYKLKRYLRNRKGDILIYSYWFDIASYAAVLLKKKKVVDFVVTRAHGFDVYEDRRPYSYMPLKRQFKDCYDRILALSEKGKDYLSSTYLISNDKISVNRLGVEIEDGINIPTDDDTYVISSVSFCIPVKRIDKIIAGIRVLSESKKKLKIRWDHIGSGPELNKLKKLSESQFKGLNIAWTFHGEMTNKEVKYFLKNNRVDVFINTSDSEGVPVSIMEAMSFGIPAIAPNIGGISELVNESNGVLLKADPDVHDIFTGLSKITHFKNAKVRSNAKLHIFKYFNSQQNYRDLIAYFETI